MKFYEFMGHELIEKVKNKECTVQEIIQSCFERIHETGSKLHSFVQLKEDQALKKAIKADENFFFISAMNPEELSGTHRLSEALKDRIKVWIKLDYPQKSTELEIIRVNLPENFSISESELEDIYSIIDETRKNCEDEKKEGKSPRSRRDYSKILASNKF